MDTNYNLTSLIERVKMRLKDVDYSEDDIAQFINDAYFEYLGEDRYTFLERAYECTATEGGIVALPHNFQTLIHITATNQDNTRSLEYLAPKEFMALPKGDGRKMYRYTIFGGKLFVELPSVDFDGDEDLFYQLNLYYLAKPVTLEDDTECILFPREYSEILILGALKRAEQLRDNFDYAQIYENSANEMLINMKQRYCPRQMDGGNRAHLPVRMTTRF